QRIYESGIGEKLQTIIAAIASLQSVAPKPIYPVRVTFNRSRPLPFRLGWQAIPAPPGVGEVPFLVFKRITGIAHFPFAQPVAEGGGPMPGGLDRMVRHRKTLSIFMNKRSIEK